MTLHRQEKKISERFHFFREKKTLPAKGLCFGRFSVVQHCSREMTNVGNLSKRFYLVWPQLWNIYINPGSCSFVCFSRTQFLHFYSNLTIAIDLIGRFPNDANDFQHLSSVPLVMIVWQMNNWRSALHSVLKASTPHGSLPLEMRTDEEVVMELLLLSTRRRRGRRGLNGISLTLYYELRRLWYNCSPCLLWDR